MAKVGKILTTIVLALAAACSTNNAVVPDTVLKVTVLNESTNLPLKGATIYLYDNTDLFTQTISSIADPSGYITSLVANDSGKVVIPKLKAGVHYYVYAYFRDTSIVKGTYITLDNSSSQYVLKNELTRSSITSITIPVRPSDGFIVFWTHPSNNAALPIDAFIANAAAGTLTQGNTAPVAFQSGSVTARARAGQATVEGKSSTGCLWAGQTKVNAGGFSFYSLQDCSVGTVAFYTDNVNATVLPIQLMLNANDGIGNISSVVSATPTICAALNLIRASRVPGSYTYQAVSPSGNCVWNGTFTLTAGGCNLIYLNQCN